MQYLILNYFLTLTWLKVRLYHPAVKYPLYCLKNIGWLLIYNYGEDILTRAEIDIPAHVRLDSTY